MKIVKTEEDACFIIETQNDGKNPKKLCGINGGEESAEQ
jgi:hypothetical protein